MTDAVQSPAASARFDASTQLRQIVDHATAAVFVKDLAGRFLFVNRAFERMTGMTVDALAGRSDADVFPAAADAFHRNDERVLAEGRAIDFEEVVDTAEGRRVYLSHKFPLFDADGRAFAVCGIATDITERQRGEAALRAAALAVSSAEGEGVFGELVRYLAEILHVELAMIAVFADDAHTHMRALAACDGGAPLPAFEYALDGTPCALVVGRAFRFVGQGVREQFPGDTMFRTAHIESYAALPLNDSSGRPLGLIAAMDRKPMRDAALAEAMLKIFAVRAVAEIERTRGETALRASEASYRAVFESSEDPIFVHDWDSGAILDANPKAAEVYGHPVAELRHMAVAQLSENEPPYTQAEAREWIERAKAGQPVRFEWRARHRDGHLMWHEIRLKPAMIAGQRRILAFIHDITAGRAAEDALRASEEQYRAIFNASADALILWNSRMQRVDVNPAYERIFGYSREEIMAGGRANDLPDDYARPRNEIVLRTLAGEDCHEELDSIRRNGEKFRCEVRTIRIQHRGEPHVLAMARDVTEQRSAEDALRASEEQYRAIFNASADALVLWNSRLERVDVNPAHERMLGYSRDEILAGARTDEVPEDYARRCKGIILRTLAGEDCQEELDTVRRNGEPLRTEVRTIRIQHRGEPHVLAMGRDVTEQRRAEQAMRASEEQYRAIFNASVDGLLLWDAEHRIVDANDAFLAMHGLRRVDVVGQVEPIFIPEDLRAQCSTMLARVIDGEACFIEARTRRKDGSAFDVEIRGVRMRYQGRPHVLIAVRDITERREAEERLRASEERYRLLFEMESDAILVVDADTLELLDANRAAEELWRYSRDELMRLKATDLSAERDATQRTLQGEDGPVAVPMRWHRKKDGTLFPAEITLNRFELSGRRIVLAAIRDITERRQREEALARSEDRLRATVEAAFDCVIGMDGAGRLIEFNQAAERVFGRRRADVLGKPLSELLIPPNKRQAHEHGLERFRRTGDGPYIGRRIETTALRADGTEFPVELAVSVARAGDGNLFVGYLRDIGERKEAERRRADLEAQLRQAQKMEAIGHLTGGIAHDFNNLLTGIVGYVTLAAERSGGADAKVASYLEQAGIACGRARDLIQQMLTFSRGRRGEPQALSLAPLIRESVKLLRSSFPATVDLSTDLGDAPQVLLDRVQLDQVLMNLAINARDAVGANGRIGIAVRHRGPTRAICSSCRSDVEGDLVELAVVDSGGGIPPGIQERMFEPFFTTKAVGRGSGMGLSTVHGIVHEHGGHIVVESEPGKGTTFRVLLPALRPQDAAGAQAPSGGAVGALPRIALAGRVAVVDDEVSVAGFMQELLEQWGLETTLFAGAGAALDAMAGGREFDLVITDQTMPGMTGLEFARAAHALHPRLPIVLYTGYGEGIAPADLERAGVLALVAKPIDPSKLVAVLSRHLQAPLPAGARS